MRKFYQYALFTFLMIFFSQRGIAQQDVMFSQFYASSLYLNPALSGLEHQFAVVGIHRTQWSGLSPYITNSLSAIIPYHDKGENAYHKGGFGANFYNINSGNGNLITNGFSLSGAYNLHLAATTAQNLTFGLQVGFVQKQFNNLQWGSNYDVNSGGYNSALSGDPLLSGSSAPSKIYPDISAGLLYYYNAGRNIYAPGISFYFGTAFSHLNFPNESTINGQTSVVPLMWKLHSGFEIHVAKMLNFSPNILYIRQGNISMPTLGANFTYLIPDHDDYLKPTRIVFGSSYRFGQALIFQVGFGSKYYSLGFSYDWYLSSIKSALKFANNAFEISFKTTFHLSKKSKKSSKFHTPLM